jgi:hypothetical protein
MYELPVALHLGTESVRRQFDPAAPPEPDRPRRSFRSFRSFRPIRGTRVITAAALHRAARAVAPAPEYTATH